MMRQIADWLGRLGLRQYSQCFAKNDIDFAILRELTDPYLEEHAVPKTSHAAGTRC
jgi:hypothetical protein